MRFSGIFLSCKANARRSVHSPQDHSIIPLSLATDVTDATLWTSGHSLGTRTGAGSTATLTKSFLAAAHGSMDSRSQNNGPCFEVICSLCSFLNVPIRRGWIRNRMDEIALDEKQVKIGTRVLAGNPDCRLTTREWRHSNPLPWSTELLDDSLGVIH